MGIAKIIHINKKNKFQTNTVEMPQAWISQLKVGDSVSNNGCCLTVAEIQEKSVCFDLIDETLKRTNLGLLKEEDQVNIELSAKIGDPIGGHIMSGHIMDTAKIINTKKTANNYQVWIEYKQEMQQYIWVETI